MLLRVHLFLLHYVCTPWFGRRVLESESWDCDVNFKSAQLKAFSQTQANLSLSVLVWENVRPRMNPLALHCSNLVYMICHLSTYSHIHDILQDMNGMDIHSTVHQLKYIKLRNSAITTHCLMDVQEYQHMS